MSWTIHKRGRNSKKSVLVRPGDFNREKISLNPSAPEKNSHFYSVCSAGGKACPQSVDSATGRQG